MNPAFGRSDQAPLESDLWDVLSRIPGTDCRETLELIYRCARSCEGIVLLNRPSARAAASAVLGALASDSQLGPVRVYLVDPSRQQLMLVYGELSRIDLGCDVTLYHGSLMQFFRDLPLSADLICTDSRSLELLGRLQSSFSCGSVILGFNETGEAGQVGAQCLIDAGMIELEAMTSGGVVYRTTHRCRSPRFVPRTGLRVELQGKLHERYFLSEAGADADHTPVADLAEDIRREFTHSFPGASGLGPWPYSRPESGGLPLTLPSGKPWPKISIVTPTLNQGSYLEETILSVLHQDYPNVEHIVVDGASTDETPSILDRYRDRLALVISEPDNGQSHAINKGMSKATGEIVTWLNGDDMLAPGALASVALAFDVNNADMIAGICRLYRDGSLESQHLTCCADGPLALEDLLDLDQGWNAGQSFIQPEVMFTKEIWLRAGGRVNERLHYAMDYELWLRFAQAGARLHVIGRPVAWFRLHEEQKISARSSVALELTTCRDAFSRKCAIKLKSAPALSSWRQKLRITILRDETGSGAHLRLARALARAGHEISIVAVQDPPSRKGLWEGLLDRVSATHADLVILCDENGVSAAPQMLHLLSKRFRTIVISGNKLAYGPSAETIRWNFSSDVFRPRNKQACRENLGLPMDRFLILLAPGWDAARDESHALLDALDRLELANTLVVTAGAPIQRSRYPVGVVPANDINDPHKLALLNSAVDVVVAPSLTEAVEQVYIEAIACGTPVAGYHTAMVPEAIRGGVTGVLASDNNPASLAAAIHYMYVRPDLRNDLSKWGRLYVENEWSEFSAYRSVFQALEILGLTKPLKLRRKIEFLPNTPQVPVHNF